VRDHFRQCEGSTYLRFPMFQNWINELSILNIEICIVVVVSRVFRNFFFWGGVIPNNEIIL
jgi:hypothetical protein